MNGVGRDLYKDPVTDNGTKRSARGRLAVQATKDGTLELIEQATSEQEARSLLRPVFENGILLRRQSFLDVRKTLWEQTLTQETLGRNMDL